VSMWERVKGELFKFNFSKMCNSFKIEHLLCFVMGCIFITFITLLFNTVNISGIISLSIGAISLLLSYIFYFKSGEQSLSLYKTSYLLNRDYIEDSHFPDRRIKRIEAGINKRQRIDSIQYCHHFILISNIVNKIEFPDISFNNGHQKLAFLFSEYKKYLNNELNPKHFIEWVFAIYKPKILGYELTDNPTFYWGNIRKQGDKDVWFVSFDYLNEVTTYFQLLFTEIDIQTPNPNDIINYSQRI
jgi:hypothetical protein